MRSLIAVVFVALMLSSCASREDRFYSDLAYGVGKVMQEKDKNGDRK